MNTNDTGREPTDAEHELVLELYRAARRLAGDKTLSDVQAVIDAVNEVPWSTIKRLSGARPMPDTPAPVTGNECEHGHLHLAIECETCQLVRAEARIAELEAALADCIESVIDWAGYATEYFQRKHDLSGEIARFRAVLHSGKDTPDA